MTLHDQFDSYIATNEALAQSLGADSDGAAPATIDEPSAAAGASLQKALRVAVYNLELQGIDNTIGTVVTDSLIAEIRKLQGISAIGMDQI